MPPQLGLATHFSQCCYQRCHRCHHYCRETLPACSPLSQDIACPFTVIYLSGTCPPILPSSSSTTSPCSFSTTLSSSFFSLYLLHHSVFFRLLPTLPPSHCLLPPLFVHCPFLFSLFFFLSKTLVHTSVPTDGTLVMISIYQSNQNTETGLVPETVIFVQWYKSHTTLALTNSALLKKCLTT